MYGSKPGPSNAPANASSNQLIGALIVLGLGYFMLGVSLAGQALALIVGWLALHELYCLIKWAGRRLYWWIRPPAAPEDWRR